MNISNRNNKLAHLRELEKPTMTQFLSNLLDEEIGDDDNLFAHGMNSLKVVQFVSRMRRLGQFLNVRDVYQNPTVNQLKKSLLKQITYLSHLKPAYLVGRSSEFFHLKDDF